MKHTVLTSVLLSLGLSASAQAAISIAGNNLGGSGRVLADAAGSPLPTGSVVRVGFFNDPVADIAIISGTDFSAIDQKFNSLGEGVVPNSGSVSAGALAIGANAGRFSFTVQNVQQSYLPAGKQMFYWVFNSSTASTATQWALFTNDDTSGGGSPWLSVLENTEVPGSGDLSLAVQQARVDDASDVITGTLNADQLRLAVIPEPSLAALCLSAGALLFRRRRS
jgi:hypothetical protein